MKISLFTGCVIPIRYPGMEAAARFAASRLGIELADVKFGCCPSPVGLKAVHFDAWLALAARNLCLTEERGLDVVTICAGCTNTLRETNHILAQDEKKRLFVHETLRRLGREYRGTMRIFHFPELLARDEFLDRLEREVSRPLRGLRVGTHYGCHYFRPSAVMGEGAGGSTRAAAGGPLPGETAPEGKPSKGEAGEAEYSGGRDAPSPLPESMEVILETLGAEVVDYNRQDLCCGAALTINTGRSAESLANLSEKLGWMREAGLEALAVACPACFTQFDTGQLLLARRDAGLNPGPAKQDAPGAQGIPVFHIAELVAFALGMEPGAMDLGNHKIRPTVLSAGRFGG